MNPFLLTSDFDDSFEYDGKMIHLDLSFDNVLRMFEMFDDDTFYEWEKIEIALEMLIVEYSVIEDIPFVDKNYLFIYIFKEFLGIDMNSGNKNQGKLYDFKQDAGIIYASFLRSYRIDLFEQHGKLHWHKFIQLLQHLDDKSKFKEVLNIRQMKVPSADKYNKDYRDYVIQMKRTYALERQMKGQDAVKVIDEKWNALAQSLKPRG